MNMFRSVSPGREGEQKDEFKFDKLLLFNEAFLEWKEFNHPQFGKIEIGGFKKQVGRIPPSFLLEEECHRNMAFTLFNASLLPSLSVEEINRVSLGKDLYRVTAVIRNSKQLPTKLDVDVQNKLTRADWIYLKGPKVVTGGIKKDRFAVEFAEQKHNPQRLEVPRIEGNSFLFVTWIVKGKDKITVEVDSEKGGKTSKQLN